MDRKRALIVNPYVVGIASVAIATLITMQWLPLRHLHNLSLFFVAVVLTAFYGGWLPSVVAMILSAIAFSYFIAPPLGFAVGDPEDQFRLVAFIAVASLFCFLHGARAKAEEKVRSLAQRLSFALEATRLGVWDLNLRSGVIWHSESMEEIYGRSGDRFAQAYEVFLGYVHPDDRDFVHRTVTGSIESGEEFHIQHRVVWPKGDLRWVGTRARIFFDEMGLPERLVAVTTDITDRPGASTAPAAVQRAPLPPGPGQDPGQAQPAAQIIPA